MKNKIMKKELYDVLWGRLLNEIKNEYFQDPYEGLRIARMDFNNPLLLCSDCDLIVLSIMRLLIKYAYSIKCDYGKFTIGFLMKIENGGVPFTLSKAITFKSNGQNLPVYALIKNLIRHKAENYDNVEFSSIFIRIYLNQIQSNEVTLTPDDEIASMLWEYITSEEVVEPIEVRTIGRSKRRYYKYITALKPPQDSKRQKFIVADTDTLMQNDVHVPYAVGFLVVIPDSSEAGYGIETYFSEDYPISVFETFEDRSSKMMFDFVERLAVVVRKHPLINAVYFHNFSRFDGIILMKHLVTHGAKYTIKPLMRDHKLYELSVYLGKKLLFSFRDSLTLLPGSLANLAVNLCPELGGKGTIAHEEVQVSNLYNLRSQLLEYMKQDIYLLGGVMLKAQDIYFNEYNVDIVTKLTLSSLALTIFRTNYYDSISFPIHIPNEDTFIRRGYYGGHTDVYKPKGTDLYYYDVNSLYPHIMKSYPMPGGKPVWHGHLEGQELDNLFGFIEAYVVCPRTINHPFLPYRDDKDNTLLFPTGHFVGVYYSEELKYAKNLGYQIIPLSGYLFEKMPSPFEGFVSSLFGKRQEAKKTGNSAMSFVYKILMNSLYGRFGINPKNTITEVCDVDRYNSLLKKPDFISGNKLSDNIYIVSYNTNTEDAPDSEWSPPRISAVQLSAAITACARIEMYPHISRDD